jgi:hypothetical protein
MKDELLASRAEDTKRLKRELQLRASSDANACGHLDGNPKRQRVHDSSSSSSSPERSAPLDKDEVLDEVFSFVGGGDHLYAAGVSRRWRGRYMQYCVQNSTSESDEKFVTRHCSAIVSESRLQHAKLNGLRIASLDITQDTYARLICEHCLEPEQVVTLLKLHDVPCNDAICREAAYYDRLSLLQWLHSNDCQWDEHNVLTNASRGGGVAMLQWLATVTEPWPQEDKTEMLEGAVNCDRLAAAKWLRALGAAWPHSFASDFESTWDGTVQQCWSLSAIQWALAAGSGWREWKCEDYDVT